MSSIRLGNTALHECTKQTHGLALNDTGALALFRLESLMGYDAISSANCNVVAAFKIHLDSVDYSKLVAIVLYGTMTSY